jgi:catechol 2,3-dioxygenase-like lactoylglutathione lyase family enzyme
LDTLLKKGWAKSPRAWRRALALGATEVLWGKPEDYHGIVHSWVELSKRGNDSVGVKVVNGTLRSFLRMLQSQHPGIGNCMPQAFQKLCRNQSLDVDHMIAVLDEPRSLHWFSSRLGLPDLEEVQYTELGEKGLFGCRLKGGFSPKEILDRFGGFFQNVHAAEVCLEVSRQSHSEMKTRLLDFCAAPGGKTRQLSRLGVRGLSFWDENPKRREEMMRSSLCDDYPELKLADARDLDGGSFQSVLLDVPCSNSGVLNKCPEAMRHFWKPEDSFREVQEEALLRGMSLISEGGTLYYSTCSMDPSENGERALGFADRYGLRVVRQRNWFPSKEGGHGAYLASLQLCE